jgi:hypothetical protein
MTAPAPVSPLVRRLLPSEVPPTGVHVVIEADADARAELARLAEALSVEAMRAELEVKPWGRDGWSVAGRVVADLTQACVVTLEPVATRVDETVELKLVPPEAMARYEEKLDEEGGIDVDPALDLPEPIEDGVIDIGAIVLEHFLVGVEPYPRKPGAEFDAEAAGVGEGRAELSPFAALARFGKE